MSRMSRTSGRLLKCILKNHNLPQSFYEVLRTKTKKNQEGCMFIKIEIIKKRQTYLEDENCRQVLKLRYPKKNYQNESIN